LRQKKLRDEIQKENNEERHFYPLLNLGLGLDWIIINPRIKK
jgi:hypothetical protein